MSLKKIEQLKADKGFKIWDLIIYGVFIAFAVILLIVFLTTRDTSPLSGVRFYSKGVAVFEYNFDKDEYNVLNSFDGLEIENTADILTVTITTEEGYNTVEILKSGTVRVIDADCRTKDCVVMHEITDNSGMIYCSPHGLRITPYDFEPDSGIIII